LLPSLTTRVPFLSFPL
jgi:glycogen synthase kinase 3 beta